MRFAEVIGKVTLSAMHPTLEGARWVIGVPLAAEGLKDRRKGRGEPIVIYDELSAGEGAPLPSAKVRKLLLRFIPNRNRSTPTTPRSLIRSIFSPHADQNT